jgi:hypothetical protein
MQVIESTNPFFTAEQARQTAMVALNAGKTISGIF